MSDHVAVVGTACANCGAELGGPFCHGCGQKAVGPVVSLREFFHEAFEEFAHVDGKIVQTVKLLLTKPGMLTREFLAGRRATYVSPLRVYLICSVIFFALAAIAPVDARPFFTITPGGSSGFSFESPEQLRDATVAANRAIVRNFPRVMFALMPVFGLMTWVLYRKARPFYAAHLYYSIHFHAFAFLALTLLVTLRVAGGYYGAMVAGPATFVIHVYLYMSLHRVFGGSAWQTAWKGTLLAVVYTVVIFVPMVLIGVGAAANASKTPAPAQQETH